MTREQANDLGLTKDRAGVYRIGDATIYRNGRKGWFVIRKQYSESFPTLTAAALAAKLFAREDR